MKKLVRVTLNYATVGAAYLCECKDIHGNIFMANVIFGIGQRVNNRFNKEHKYFYKELVSTAPFIMGNPITKKKVSRHFDLVKFDIVEIPDAPKYIYVNNTILKEHGLKRYGDAKFTVEIDTSWDQKSNAYFHKVITDNDNKEEIVVSNSEPIFKWIKNDDEFSYLSTYGNIDEQGIFTLDRDGKSVLKRFKFDLEDTKKKMLEAIEAMKTVVIHYEKDKGIIYALDNR